MFIEAIDLHFTYMPGTPFEVKALKGVSFRIERGQFLGLMGPTGSGKSTLVQLLNGLLRPAGGTVLVDGVAVNKTPGALRRRIGMVFQLPERQLFAETVYDDVAFGPHRLGLEEREVDERVYEALSRVGLDVDEIKDRSPFNLSGGQMRRVAIAGVLAMRPEVLILDEPTAMLDPAGRRELLGYVRGLQEKDAITIILVSHRLEELADYAQELLVLNEGKVLIQGSRSEVFGHAERLREVGLGMPPVMELMHRLREKGLEVRTDIFSAEDAFREIVGCTGG